MKYVCVLVCMAYTLWLVYLVGLHCIFSQKAEKLHFENVIQSSSELCLADL